MNDPRKLRTRATVLDATVDLLLEVGCERMTLDAVAEKSGVARSTIYRNWADRSELIMQAVDCVLVIPGLNDTGTLAGDLSVLGELLAHNLDKGPLGKLLPSLVGAAAFDPDLRERLQEFSQSRFEHVRGVFERGIIRGEITNKNLDGRVERFIGPFFTRHLLHGWPMDNEFVKSQVAAALEFETIPDP